MGQGNQTATTLSLLPLPLPLPLFFSIVYLVPSIFSPLLEFIGRQVSNYGSY